MNPFDQSVMWTKKVDRPWQL